MTPPLLSLLSAALSALPAERPAVYAVQDSDILLRFGGRCTKISPAMLKERAMKRGSDMSVATLESLIHDSLVPLTIDDPARLQQEALEFLSAFTSQAVWITGTAIDLLAEENGRTPATVFLRKRYPSVTWEWQIETPSSNAKGDTGHGFQLVTMWTAWAVPSPESFHENPFVARGRIEDWVEVQQGAPLIAQRKMIIESLVRPQDMRTSALLLLDPSRERGVFAGMRLAGNKVVAVLESVSRLSSTLVAISALLSAVQGIVAEYSTIGGLVLGSLGSFVASLTVLSLSVASASRALHTAAATRIGEYGDGEAEATAEDIAGWEQFGRGAG